MKISVNGEMVPEALIQREMQGWHQQHPNDDEAAAFEGVKDRIVEWTLIRQASQSQIEVSENEVDAEFKLLCQQHGGKDAFLQRIGGTADAESNVKADLKLRRQSTCFLDLLTKDADAPTEDQVTAYFEKHQDHFTKPETVHAAHIVKHPQSEAAENAAAVELTALRKRLLNGEDFMAVAAESSECNDTPPDLGEFPRGKMVPEFELVVFSMNPGEISPVFKTPFGLHLATVRGRKEAAPMTLEEAKPQIHQRLLQETKTQIIRAWVAQQAKEVTVL